MKFFFLCDFKDLKYIIPEIFFLFSIFILVLFLLIFSFSKIYKYPLITTISNCLTIFNLILILILLLNNITIKSLLFNNVYLTNFGFSSLKCIIIFFTIICLIVGLQYLKDERINDFEYFILLLFVTLGVILLTSVNDFILTYLTIEIQSLSLFVLVSLKKNTLYSTEAGLKYFILGSLSSIFLLFGFSLLYFIFGTTNFQEISLLFFYNLSFNFYSILSFFSLIFILSGFFFKLSVVPLHMWLPDVYEGAPSIITLYMAVIPKIAFFFVICRLLFLNFSSFFYNVKNIIIIVSIFSIIVGSFMGIQQQKFKRLYSYSTISHIGFILFGFSTGSLESLKTCLIYLFIYMITSICLWGVLISLRIKKKFTLGIFLSDYCSLFYINPVITFIFSLILLSLAGIPPLIGFWVKFLILIATMNSNYFFTSMIIIFISSISTFYYLRIIKILYFNDKFYLNLISFNQIKKENAIILSFFFIFLINLMVYPNFIIIFVNKVVFSIF